MNKANDILEMVKMGVCGAQASLVVAEELSAPERRLSLQHTIDQLMPLRGLLLTAAGEINLELYVEPSNSRE
jgi:hypothetical protein